MTIILLFLVGLLGADGQTCSSFYGSYTAPATVEFTASSTGTYCWRFYGAGTYHFINYTIDFPTWDIFYFFDTDVEAMSSTAYEIRDTYGISYTSPPAPYTATTTGMMVLMFYSTSGELPYFQIQVDAINPNGAPCSTPPPNTYVPGGYGYTSLDPGTCVGSIASGSYCNMNCNSPKTMYSTDDYSPYFTQNTLYCSNGNWLPIKYPTICYYASTCLGSSLGSIVDITAYDYSACQSGTFSSGDTCSISCKPNYVADPAWQPVYVECDTLSQSGYPATYHSQFSLGPDSTECMAPCLQLPHEMQNPTLYPGFLQGSCLGGSDQHHGKTCVMACAQSYTQTGSLMSTCNNGVWSYVQGTCEAPCIAQPVLTNPPYIVGCNLPSPSRTSCLVTCASPYVASGDMTVSCGGGGSGLWSGLSGGGCLAPCLNPPNDPVNGSYSKSCTGTLVTGSHCPLTCNAGSVASADYSTCSNGGWTGASCDRYQWTNSSWYSCDTTATTCVAGVTSSNLGVQTRDVYCDYVLYPGNYVDDSFCSQAGPKPATSQQCSIACPQAPMINSVKPYDGAVTITFTVYDPADRTRVPAVHISYCVAAKSGGQCAFNSNTPLVNDLYQTLDTSFGAYNQSGRQITLPYYNLTNGVSYSFRIVYEHYNDNTENWEQSQYSTASAGVSPAAGNCLGGCVEGTCIKGRCSCKPGVVYASWTNCSIPATLTAPLFQFSPFNLSFLANGGLPDLQVRWTTNLPMVHVFVLPESCRSNLQCIPTVYSLFQTGGLATLTGLSSFPTGSYFVRLFWTSQLVMDSETFKILDPLCSTITCQNGGTCAYGHCNCPYGWKNATCNVKADVCQTKGLECGIWGTCDGVGKCKCIPGWNGDSCQYPPKCDLRCNYPHGSPNDPDLVLQPGNTFGCSYCDCYGQWKGDHCDQCGMTCYNGGSVNSLCTTCTCPTWYTGDACEKKYWLVSWKIKLNPPNIAFSSLADVNTYQTYVKSELVAVLGLDPYTEDLQVKMMAGSVTVWLSFGVSSVLLRENLRRQISGQYYGLNNQGLFYQSTLTGEQADMASYTEGNPPNAAGLTTPSVWLTLSLLLLLGLLNKN